jgi:hypothetical protein
VIPANTAGGSDRARAALTQTEEQAKPFAKKAMARIPSSGDPYGQIPIWHILEGRFELVLANAAHIRNVPGRKSDVNDAVWVSDLLAHGLIRASFVPPAQIQDVRDLTRTRTQLVREIPQHTQRIHKTLENANIKLTSVISRREASGSSAADMMELDEDVMILAPSL